MKKKDKFWIWLDYSCLLELFSYMPFRMGRFFAKVRGYIYYYTKRDWRIFTFGDVMLFERAFQTYKEMFPKYSKKEVDKMVRGRCIAQSVEEFEAIALKNGKLDSVGVEFVGLDSVLKYLEHSSNNIFIMPHFGSSIIGVRFFDVLRVSLLGMSSSVTKESQVHKSITKMYTMKYRALAQHLNGGDIVDIENNHKKFFKFLKEKGSLIIVADLPPIRKNEEPYWVNWFGKRRGLASGIDKLSKSVGCEVIGFVCYFEKGKYILKFSNVGEDAYKFLEDEIKKRAYLWWGSDLMGHYPIKNREIDEEV